MKKGNSLAWLKFIWTQMLDGPRGGKWEEKRSSTSMAPQKKTYVYLRGVGFCQSWISIPPWIVGTILTADDGRFVAQNGTVCHQKSPHNTFPDRPCKKSGFWWGNPSSVDIFSNGYIQSVRSSNVFKSYFAAIILLMLKSSPNTPGEICRKTRWEAAHWMLWQHRQALGSRSRPMSSGGTWPTFLGIHQNWQLCPGHSRVEMLTQFTNAPTWIQFAYVKYYLN